MKPEAIGDWIKADTSAEDLKEIIGTQIHTDFAFLPVSKAVNSVKNNSEDLIKEA